MKTRLLLSLFLVPALAFLIFFNSPYPFIITAVAALTAALVEVYNMLMKKGLKPYRSPGALFGIIMYIIIIMDYPKMLFISAWACLILLLFILVIFSRKPDNFTRTGATAFPLMYISILGSFALQLRLMENGYYWIFLLFFLTLIYDAGAYFAGSFFGKHKLIPEISPGKSIEGCLGGVIINVIATVIAKYAWLPQDILGPNTLIHLIILAVLLAVMGQLGDLTASVIKRYCGVKNSSNLLPEMGGVLDKIDSALFNSPVLYLYIVYVTQLF
ncbi:MAG: phosphatidate cytidylyltransferase [Spirochaetia bacterium]|nr:phosphatidate cytidylyltransferase [Spirochaetia bacterium]